MIEAGTLRELLEYDRETGIFIWKVCLSPRAPIGSVAGRLTTNRYNQIGIKGKRYLAHRLAWLYVYGEWPKKSLDHINRIKTDNRIDNLRDVHHSQNVANSRRFKGGIMQHKSSFYARVGTNGSVYLGKFESKEDAIAARAKAAAELYGYGETTS
jgi:hypothetical protein